MDDLNSSIDPSSRGALPRWEEPARHRRALTLVVIILSMAMFGWVLWAGRGDWMGGSSRVVAAPREAMVAARGEATTAADTSPIRGAATEPSTRAAPTDQSEQLALGSPAPRVHVVGAIRKSGVYALSPKARVIDAIRQAGGARADADLEAVNLADFVRDGEQIRIPTRRETAQARLSAQAIPTSRSESSDARRALRPASPSARSVPSSTAGTRTVGRYAISVPVARSGVDRAGESVNINTADVEALDTLPGVGPATAEAIIQFRREHGPFQRPEDLLQVRGIGEKKLAAMLDRVTVR